ncbi:response regulator [Pseudodesulfovibrio sp. JC047]|uniref:HD domain-containing phosphohydrolase n=1 Tax=Pseudodesulfovibrio sp. JC047 TaxID=2683199 RepID=UPI0013D34CD8|nr:HD domain-containing phosphohydrolase [Pseudodesulfovibrio sp. JC047]NDV18577.1 response regulator [Pseudodesulfovibrio sp. JC047]
MPPRILLVDDEPNVLSALRRQLRDRYRVETATNPAEALDTIDKMDPFSVVVSDFRMPQMNGIEFLNEFKTISPDTTRLMLTGYADLDNAIKAVNDGNVFRFLTKPCEKDLFLRNVKDAVTQYELVTIQKILLEKTLKGSVELLNEITALVNPEAGERINRVRRYVRYLAAQKGITDFWRYDIATMLSQLGTLILPPGTIADLLNDKELTAEQLQLFEMHPVIAQNLIAKLPRLDSIGEMVSYQLKGYDGTGTPKDPIKGTDIPIGGRILKMALDYDLALHHTKDPQKAFLLLEENRDKYDPELLYHLRGMLGVESRYTIRTLHYADLQPGMILHEDVVSTSGALLLKKSLELNKEKVDRIALFAKKVGIDKDIVVLVPELIISTIALDDA